VDPPPLRGRRLGHCADQHCRSRDVLASAIEDWGLLTPFVIMDAVMHIAGPLSGSPDFTVTSLFLFESVSKLLQKKLVLFDLGLELMELFQVWALRSRKGGGLVSCGRRDNAWRCGSARTWAKQGMATCPLILLARSQHPEPDVKTLASGVVGTLVVVVRVAEAVIACGQELAHSPRVVESGEIHFGPCLVLL